MVEGDNMTIKAHFDGKVFVPDEPVNLPRDQSVLLNFEATSGAPASESKEDIDRLFEELERLAVVTNHPVDDSRDSIYSGTIDDPR